MVVKNDSAGSPDAPPLKLMACLSRSPQARAIAAESLALARLLNARLVFVHVGETAADFARELAESLRELDGAPQEFELTVRDGKPADVICDLARRERVDLVIAGALEREGLLESLTMGSIARRIARNAPCSVLLLAKGQSPARDGFREIVAATRLDDYSREMLRVIAGEARRVGTHVLHVVQELDDYEMMAFRYEEGSMQERQERQRRWMLEHQALLINFLEALDFGGLNLRAKCLRTGEGLAAMEYAERCNADLLVYPAPPRRLTFWDGFFNNPASAVLQQIACALLFYRPSPHRPRRREVQ